MYQNTFCILVISLLQAVARPSSSTPCLVSVYSIRVKPTLLVMPWLSMLTHAYIKEPTVFNTANLNESWFSQQYVSKSCWLKLEVALSKMATEGSDAVIWISIFVMTFPQVLLKTFWCLFNRVVWLNVLATVRFIQ